MTFEELIDQLDCKVRANTYPPYNEPGRGYPDHLIGVQELLKTGDDEWELGTKVCLGDRNARRKLADLWDDVEGGEPRWIVRLPC